MILFYIYYIMYAYLLYRMIKFFIKYKIHFEIEEYLLIDDQINIYFKERKNPASQKLRRDKGEKQ